MLFRSEPIEHRLLAHADRAGDLIERHRFDTPEAEEIDGFIEDPISRGTLGHRRSLASHDAVYHLVENLLDIAV